ncbi:hypothetical protein [Paenibacillus sp. FSL K6-1230]|uniref:hypothetical protein n=1 Tax=Paenibacillus sp. FSL K6-1230 TaxID=2921603 RepID=UPI0030F841E8
MSVIVEEKFTCFAENIAKNFIVLNNLILSAFVEPFSHAVEMAEDGYRWVQMGADGCRWVQMGADGTVDDIDRCRMTLHPAMYRYSQRATSSRGCPLTNHVVGLIRSI